MYTLILVDYNSIDDTTEYIRRCWDAMGEKGAAHVVIVENGSNEGVPEKLEHLYGPGTACAVEGVSQAVYCYQSSNQQILYCHSGENMGYAKGNNLGAEIARVVWNDPFYIISNNDLVFEKKPDLCVVDEMFNKDASIGVIGPRVVGLDGLPQSPHRWSPAYRRLILFYWRLLLAPLRDAVRKYTKSEKTNKAPATVSSGPCDWVMGCLIFVRASAFFEAGMFDPHTFLFAEEMILSRRMEAVGKTVWFCQEMEVLHFHAQTTLKTVSVWRRREMDFEAVLYYYKTYTNTAPILLTLARWNFAVHKVLFFGCQKLQGIFVGNR